MSASVAPGGRLWDAGEVAGRAADFCFEWNAENQLTRVLSNGSEVARYKYDPLGRRVEKVAGGTTTAWTYDQEDAIRVIVGGSGTSLIHGPGIDEPLAEEAGTGTAYFHSDALGSPTAMTNAAGVVGDTFRFEAFGSAAGASGRYGFTAREWDVDAGAYYYRARYYDPKIGRFISEDPVGFEESVNFYAYALGNPALYVDPDGLQAFPVQECQGYKGSGSICCKNGKLAICIPPGLPRIERECLVEHEEQHALACTTSECDVPSCTPVGQDEPAVREECRPHWVQYQCLTKGGESAAAATIKKRAQRQFKCDTSKTPWRVRPPRRR